MNVDTESILPPCVQHEDRDLLVVLKPPGWNTHAPAPFAGEGIYEWLRHREPRWAPLAIVHRLDKDTSGLMVFGKTPEANRSLTAQFARRQVSKEYTLVTDRPVRRERFVVESKLSRVGDHYVSRPMSETGDRAETRFQVVRQVGPLTWIKAEPITGRTHQIRIHAAAEGIPILGDVLYGGTPALRLHLHSAVLELQHPVDGRELRFEADPDFQTDPAILRRRAILDSRETTAWRCLHGAADGRPGWYADRLGDWVLVQGENAASPADVAWAMAPDLSGTPPRGVYFKRRLRQVRQTSAEEASPQLLSGEAAPARFSVRENGMEFGLGMAEGYSVGLFLDQRDNRRRLLRGHVAAGFPLHASGTGTPEVLNCFSYTCAFSVCAARGGARTTSLDLSRNYLDWGRDNFVRNGMDPAAHDFIYGDVFDWLQRLLKKPRRFDVILLDPPTFSRSREHGDFRSESDYDDLVGLALPLLKPGGVLFSSTNAARLLPERFLTQVHAAIAAQGRRVLQEHYVPQPPDFPISREEPAYLKTVWMKVSGA